MIGALSVLLSAMMAVTPAPRDTLLAEMILLEVSREDVSNPSATRQDAGQCRRFQINSFAEAAEAYRLAGYPDVELYLPSEHATQAVSGRPVGACWDMPDTATGNAFVEVARYDYDASLSQRENLQAAREFLTNVRAGDQLQMLATYSSGGRGTHTLMFTQPYDPRSDMLYWADSNFANRMVDGVKYGVVRGYQSWPLNEVAGWISAEGGNGATLYRLTDEVVYK